ncbi:MAG: beta-propeller domain-containing protein, partial [Ruminococcus sp.]|nr:beta-propeller domain-containing protein [Ruminococcus sp.]
MYFLKDKISESGVKAPGDMDERYVLDTLRDVTLKPIEPEPKVKKKFNWKPLVAAAAVVLVAAVGTVIGVRIYQQNLIKDSTVTLNGGLSLRRFNSYDELQDEVNRIRNERKKTDAGEIISGISDFLSGSYGAKSDNDNGGYVSDGMAAESSRSGSASDSHSETYKQVDGVDEADIIKTDGKYIYCADGSYITIFSAEGDKSQKVATLNTK